MRTLHIRELTTTTTALAFGLMCSWPVSAAELELKPAFDNPGIQVASITFLPDWLGEGNTGEINMDANSDTKWCEEEGFTYYSSGKCPAYNKQITCERSKKYLKCDPLQWCKDNGYNTTACSIPTYLDTICPNGLARYKGCKEDTVRACKDLGYKNFCSSGQKLHATNGRCAYNNSYGTCCSPSACPANTSLTGSYGSAGTTDGCGYECKYTCNMNCPSGTTESNPGGCGGAIISGCGNKTCYNPYKACCNSSSSNWCSVHSTCHGDCCTDGTISSCDTRCGGRGCSSGGGSGACIFDDCTGCGSSCYHDVYFRCSDGRVVYGYVAGPQTPCISVDHGCGAANARAACGE